jgi:hypothetical protein
VGDFHVADVVHVDRLFQTHNHDLHSLTLQFSHARTLRFNRTERIVFV